MSDIDYSEVAHRLEGVDFQDTTEVIGKLLAELPESAYDLRAMNDAVADHFNDVLPEVGAVHEAVAINDHLTADVVVPRGSGPFPVMIYLHGGAWVAGSPRHYAKLSRRFAESGFLTVVVDYRLAPEYPFPAGFDDCVEAAHWAAEHCSRWGGDPARITMGGDSAGGNLSAAVAEALADTPVALKALVLIYGAYDFEAMLNRGAENDADERINIANRIAAEAYLGDELEILVKDPRVSPIRKVTSLPPCHVVVGGQDALVVQSDALVRELWEAGIEHEYYVDEYMPHGYLQMEMLPDSRPAFERIIAFLDNYTRKV